MRLQKSDPTFNMGVDIMQLIFDLEPKYRVTMLTGLEDLGLQWLKGSSGLQMGPGLG
jgi:hypothetical protein